MQEVRDIKQPKHKLPFCEIALRCFLPRTFKAAVIITNEQTNKYRQAISKMTFIIPTATVFNLCSVVWSLHGVDVSSETSFNCWRE